MLELKETSRPLANGPAHTFNRTMLELKVDLETGGLKAGAPLIAPCWN